MQSAPDPHDIAQAALKRAPRLVALPESASRASRVAEDPESDLEELAQAFSLDAALCSHLLKVANSAYYGLKSEVSSIDRAAVVLGRKILRNVALAACMQSIVRRVEQGRAFSVDALWRHSIRSAAAASTLASVSGAWDPHEAFAAGLIHDLGLLVELETNGAQLDEVLVSAAPRSAEALLGLEVDAFGANHQHFGSALCSAWAFPPALRAVAGHHHDPFSFEGPNQVLVALVGVAECLDGVSEHGQITVRPPSVPDPRLLQLLGVERDDLPDLREQIREAGDEVESAFSLSTAA